MSEKINHPMMEMEMEMEMTIAVDVVDVGTDGAFEDVKITTINNNGLSVYWGLK